MEWRREKWMGMAKSTKVDITNGRCRTDCAKRYLLIAPPSMKPTRSSAAQQGAQWPLLYLSFPPSTTLPPPPLFLRVSSSPLICCSKLKFENFVLAKWLHKSWRNLMKALITGVINDHPKHWSKKRVEYWINEKVLYWKSKMLVIPTQVSIWKLKLNPSIIKIITYNSSFHLSFSSYFILSTLLHGWLISEKKFILFDGICVFVIAKIKTSICNGNIAFRK